jgi:hypothetical protein
MSLMTWLKGVSEAIEALGSNVPITTGGFFGALLSLRFLSPDASILFRCMMVLGGFIAAIMLVPLVVSVLGIQGVNITAGVSFIIGLYGMSIISEGHELIKSGVLRDLVLGRIKRKGDGE